MYINVYETHKSECIKSYDDFNYFVVEKTDKFIIKPDFIAPGVQNVEYSYRKYHYKIEELDGMTEKENINAAIDTGIHKGLITRKVPKTSPAQLEAVAKYQRERKEIRLRVSPEIKDMADRQAKYKGLTLTAYISQLIEEDARIQENQFEEWKEQRQLEEENGLDEPITVNFLDVDIRDYESIEEAIEEAKKRHKLIYGD